MALSDKLLKQQNLINGQWINSDNQKTISVTNPATGEIIGTVPCSGRNETIRAIESAHLAFKKWKETTANERATLMHQLGDKILSHHDELAEILTTEMGKPLAEAKGEIALGVNYIRFFAEEAKRIYGDIVPSPWPDKRILILKQPVGVVGAITPWNFPNSMIARKLGAALGAGCTMVIKPASQTPYSALAYGVLAKEVGFPDGVINILTGTASEIGAEMCENPNLRQITFTGSTKVGKTLASAASAHMKKITMELGGNAPFIVFNDADLDAAVTGTIISKFRNSGQTCVCANRIYVQSGVYEEYSKKLAAAMSDQLVVGNGLDTNTTQGPLIDSIAIAKVEEHITDAVSKGGTITLGGKRHPKGENFFEPTLITDATVDMKVAREETFGPLAPLFKFETEQEVIERANDTEYGLACYFYTKDLGRSFRLMEKLDYGLIGVNEGLITTEVAPFGGMKDSGIGSEGSKYGVAYYLNIKYSCVGGLGL